MTGDEVKRQINRLSILPRWNEIPIEGKIELGEQMQKAFPDDRTGRAAIDSWLRSSQWPPTVADIWALSAEFVDKPHFAGERACDTCGGTGFAQCWELHTYTGGLDRKGQPNKSIDLISFEQYRELRVKVDDIKQRVCEAVKACSCGYGQFLLSQRRIQAAAQADAAEERKRRRAS